MLHFYRTLLGNNIKKDSKHEFLIILKSKMFVLRWDQTTGQNLSLSSCDKTTILCQLTIQ